MMMEPKITIMATKEMNSKFTKPKLNNKISVSISASRITLTKKSKTMMINTRMHYTIMKMMIVYMMIAKLIIS